MLEDFTPLVEDGLEYAIGSAHLTPALGIVPTGADDLWFIDGPGGNAMTGVFPFLLRRHPARRPRLFPSTERDA